MAYQFDARFFDGKSIQSIQANIEITKESLKICLDDPNRKLEWPKQSLQLLERPYQGKPAVIGCKLMLGARLIVESSEAFAQILPLIPSRNIKLSHVHHPWRITWLLLVALIVVIFSPIWHLPLVSMWIANVIPYSWEEDIWNTEVKDRFVGAPECVSPQGKNALNKLVTQLSKVSNTKHKFDIRVIESPNFVNAESTPGFHIFLYSGLFKMGSPDSVAGVIAHEMGHSLKHHVIASFINQMGIRTFYKTIFGVSRENIAFDFLNLKFHREYELQADKIAIDLLTKAHINPIGYRQAMEYLAKNAKEYKGLEPYLLDHPTHQERMELVPKDKNNKKMAPSLTKEEWQALKSICDTTVPIVYK
ncbi:MAG: M48 family metallopeptidase [Proteobacteria bacterium]|nr:M48 family metallopeptidase [Pseudomonadota bacterium]